MVIGVRRAGGEVSPFQIPVLESYVGMALLEKMKGQIGNKVRS